MLSCIFAWLISWSKKRSWNCIKWYCWWTKSCTTKDDDYPIVYRILTIPGGAGFRPSTVWNWLKLYEMHCILFISCKTRLLGFSLSQLVLQCRCMLRLLCSKAAGTIPFLVEWKAQRKEPAQFPVGAEHHPALRANAPLWRWHQTGKKTLKKRMRSFNILQPSQLTSIKSFSLWISKILLSTCASRLNIYCPIVLFVEAENVFKSWNILKHPETVIQHIPFQGKVSAFSRHSLPDQSPAFSLHLVPTQRPLPGCWVMSIDVDSSRF